MELRSIKINKYYLFEKEEDCWICKTHNIMSADAKIISKIMIELEKIEDILK